MRERDMHDVSMSLLGLLGDALAVLAGGMLAVWIRFDSGWLPLPFGRDPQLYIKYGRALFIALPLFLFCLHSLQLYARPQQGTFVNRIPRLIRAGAMGTVCVLLLNAIVKNYVDFSNGAILLSFPLVTLLLLVERHVLFKHEMTMARRARPARRILLVGADAVAAQLVRAFTQDPRLRAELVGVVCPANATPHPDIPSQRLRDPLSAGDLTPILESLHDIDQLILADTQAWTHNQIVVLILECEQRMIQFNMVPDLFRILTAGMEVQTIADIPLLGVSQWPLDRFVNRLLKRLEDLVGAALALLPAIPVMAVCAWRIRRESPGPVFFRQERCGRAGQPFTLYKLRTMIPDAESGSGPVFARPDDPRTTRIGAWLRRHNLDELPQLWNVLRGDMSLVGPRPERPHFVERFKCDIERYMWRHACRPGMTGWAQVNGLRGDTSIPERIRYDLFYLENWSLAFDFKILVRTIFAHRNAY